MAAFKEITYSSFEQIIVPYCHENVQKIIGGSSNQTVRSSSIEDFDRKLLCAGLTETEADEYVYYAGEGGGGLSKAFLNKIRLGKKPVPKRIMTAYWENEDVEEMTADYFEAFIIPTIKGELLSKCLYEMWDVVSADAGIPRYKMKEIEKVAKQETASIFLAKVFVFAMTRSFYSKVNNEVQAINREIKLVINDLNEYGYSLMTEHVVDLLYKRTAEGADDFDKIVYYEDYQEFVLAANPLEKRFQGELLRKYKVIKVAAAVYDVAGKKEKGEKIPDEASLYKKYGVSREEVEYALNNGLVGYRPLISDFMTVPIDMWNLDKIFKDFKMHK